MDAPASSSSALNEGSATNATDPTLAGAAENEADDDSITIVKSHETHSRLSVMKTQMHATAKKLAIQRAASAFFKVFIVIFSVIHFQDVCSDIFVARSLSETGHRDWAWVVVFFVALPGFVLCSFFLRKGEIRLALLSLIMLSYYVCARESWLMNDWSQDLLTEYAVYTIFESIPLFLFQSYLLLNSHFMSRQCERAFDLNCAQECQLLPDKLGNMTRFTCMDLQSGKTGGLSYHNSSGYLDTTASITAPECWQWYNLCINDCASVDLLVQKQHAQDTLSNMFLHAAPSSAAVREYKAVQRTTQDFANIMSEETEKWDMLGCDADGATYGTLEDKKGKFISLDPRLGDPRSPGVASTEAPEEDGRIHVKSFMSKALLMNSQIISLVSSALSVSSSLMLRTMTERTEANAEENQLSNTRWALEAFCFFLHYVVDLCACTLALSMYVVTTSGSRRTFSFLFCTCSMQVLMWWYPGRNPGNFDGKPGRRIVNGLMHMVLSPLARVPGMPDMSAALIKRMVALRVVFNVGFITYGFRRMARFDGGNYTTFIWEAVIAYLLTAATAATTYLPGPRAIWSDCWDEASRQRVDGKKLGAHRPARGARVGEGGPAMGMGFQTPSRPTA